MIQRLGEIYELDHTEFRNDVNFISVQHHKLSDLMLYLYEHMGYTYLIDVFASDLTSDLTSDIIENEESRSDRVVQKFQVSYLLKNLEYKELLCVQIEILANDQLVSQSSLWANSFAKEMEIGELFGIQYNFEQQKILLNSKKLNLMRKDFYFESGDKLNESLEAYDSLNDRLNHSKTLALSPSHFLRKYEIDFLLELNDDKVKNCEISRGHTYSGMEKICETLNVEQILNYSDKFNPLLSPVYNVLWTDTIERLLEISIPDKAMGIRMIMLELCRILDHCYSIAMMAYELDFQKYYKDMLFYVERLNELIRIYCGSVSNTSFTCVGGVRFDIPHGWISLCHGELEKIQSSIADFGTIVDTSSIWKSSLLTGQISSREAINWGLSGPNLRASGINFDLRKHNPYYFYDEVDFEVPIGQRGQALDRYLVRVEEIKQSIRIINQVLDNMPTGKIVSDEFPSLYNIKKDQLNEQAYRYVIENPMNIPKSQIYNSIESSGGELGFYVLGADCPFPRRLKLFSAASNAVAGVPSFLHGHSYRDVLLVYSSLNIHMKEVER